MKKFLSTIKKISITTDEGFDEPTNEEMSAADEKVALLKKQQFKNFLIDNVPSLILIGCFYIEDIFFGLDAKTSSTVFRYISVFWLYFYCRNVTKYYLLPAVITFSPVVLYGLLFIIHLCLSQNL